MAAVRVRGRRCRVLHTLARLLALQALPISQSTPSLPLVARSQIHEGGQPVSDLQPHPHRTQLLWQPSATSCWAVNYAHTLTLTPPLLVDPFLTSFEGMRVSASSRVAFPPLSDTGPITYEDQDQEEREKTREVQCSDSDWINLTLHLKEYTIDDLSLICHLVGH